jgi:hypothetical protein
MNNPPSGAGPRGTLPLGPGPFASPAAPRLAEREGRPTWRPPPRAPQAEPQRGAQHTARDVAPAPRFSPALRAPVRRGGRWPAPLPAQLALARRSGSLKVRATVAGVAAVAIVALAVHLRARPAGSSSETRADVAPLVASAAPTSTAPIMPEPAPPAAAMSTAPAASAPRASRASRPPGAPTARPKPTSDVVEPWR